VIGSTARTTSAPPASNAATAGSGTRQGMTDAPAAGGAGDSQPASAAAKPEGGKQTSSTQSAAKRDADAAATDPSSPADFADLLAAKTDVPPVATLPAPATIEPASVEPSQADSALPDQLLALITGSWNLPAANAPSTAPASASASRPLPTTGPATPFNLSAPIADSAPAANAAPALAALSDLAASTAAQGEDLAAATIDAPTFDPGSLANVTPAAAPPRADATVMAPPLAMPTDPDAGFDDGFGARIAWMAEQRVGHAEIRLNPEHVGPIDVRVQLDGTRVTAEFHSAHLEVRQAIEASVPRLREMLGQQGLQLGHADVGQRHGGQNPSGQSQSRAQGEHDAASGSRASAGTVVAARSRGLLDEYA
jgi:flagellar hook-length control protein FliK